MLPTTIRVLPFIIPKGLMPAAIVGFFFLSAFLCFRKSDTSWETKVTGINEFLTTVKKEGYQLSLPKEDPNYDSIVSRIIMIREAQKIKQSSTRITPKRTIVKENKKMKIVDELDPVVFLLRNYPKEFNERRWHKVAMRAQTTRGWDYIKKYKQAAINTQKRNGIPWQVTIAQGVLESDSGKSWLVKNANNHFGMKCWNKSEPHVYRHDDCCKSKRCKHPDMFKKYKRTEDSYKDHAWLLVTSENYAPCRKSKDWRVWVALLERQGYATSKDYAESLTSIIIAYNLG